MSHNSFKDIKKYKKEDTIKFGLISHNSPSINVKEIFTTYFQTLSPDKYKIKRENHYEFNPPKLPDKIISIIIISNMEKIMGVYTNLNFFILFIDMHDELVIDFLDKSLDSIIASFENTFNKKCYIFGFSEENKKKIISSKRVTTIIDAKGIDYYFCEIKKDENMNNKFKKEFEIIINDSNAIMIEKFLDFKHSELNFDKSKSCMIY